MGGGGGAAIRIGPGSEYQACLVLTAPQRRLGGFMR